MSREKQWPDWSDLYKGNVGEPESSFSKPVESRGPLNKMEKPPMPSNDAIAAQILSGAPKQPTNEQLFGHLVPSEEQVAKAEDSYNNTFNNFYTEAQKPIEKATTEWGCRGPIHKEERTEEDLRISQIPVSDGAFSTD